MSQGDTGAWEVRVEFETSSPTWPDEVDGLATALRKRHPLGAWASITDNGSTITTGATLIFKGASPGEALDGAIEAFRDAAREVGISLVGLRAAEVRQAAADPRS